MASSFEATVPWEILRGDEVVLDGFATAEGWMDKLYPWETVASTSPASSRATTPSSPAPTTRRGGAEGAGPHEDTKDFTLR